MKSLLMFIGGIVVGAGATYIYQKNRYEEMIQEEIDDLREHMKGSQGTGPVEKEDETESSDIEAEVTVEECDYMEEENRRQAEYEDLLEKNNYTDKDNIAGKFKKPFVVTPQEFASLTGFDTDTFHYYNNDVMTNDNNELLEFDEVVDLLGLTPDDIKDQFGKYQDDTVFIRNMRLKCDYEILRENEDYDY